MQVTGARAEIEGQPVLMAREVQFDGQIITLRDAQGMPTVEQPAPRGSEMRQEGEEIC